jgi:hypothetical protein
VVQVVDTPELVTEQHPDLGLRFCRPAAWTPAEDAPGRWIAFTGSDGVPAMRVERAFRSGADGGAGIAEVEAVMDAVAASWPGAARLEGQEVVETWFLGLSHARVMWYDAPTGRVKVVAGENAWGTVLAVALHGTPEWVDGDEANGILGAFLLQ